MTRADHKLSAEPLLSRWNPARSLTLHSPGGTLVRCDGQGVVCPRCCWDESPCKPAPAPRSERPAFLCLLAPGLQPVCK